MYLADGTGWLPGDRLERALVAQWLSFEQERVMSAIGGARFRRLTGRPDSEDRRTTGRGALDVLEAHLGKRSWLVGERATIADLAVFAYAHVAPDAGLPLDDRPAVRRWLERIRALPGFVDDLVGYPDHARPGASRSIYDLQSS